MHQLGQNDRGQLIAIVPPWHAGVFDSLVSLANLVVAPLSGEISILTIMTS